MQFHNVIAVVGKRSNEFKGMYFKIDPIIRGGLVKEHKHSAVRVRLKLVDSVRHISKELKNPEEKERTVICAFTLAHSSFYCRCLSFLDCSDSRHHSSQRSHKT